MASAISASGPEGCHTGMPSHSDPDRGQDEDSEVDERVEIVRSDDQNPNEQEREDRSERGRCDSQPACGDPVVRGFACLPTRSPDQPRAAQQRRAKDGPEQRQREHGTQDKERGDHDLQLGGRWPEAQATKAIDEAVGRSPVAARVDPRPFAPSLRTPTFKISVRTTKLTKA